MSAKLRHVALSVPDPEKAATFYEKALGMTRTASSSTSTRAAGRRKSEAGVRAGPRL